MKTSQSIFVLVAMLAGVALAVPAYAVAPYMGHGSPEMDVEPTGPNHYGNTHVPPPNSLSPKARALLQLRAEGLKLKAADGGTLTPEHLTYLQTKLDTIQATQY